jgi:GDP-mannose transporter
MVTVFKNIANVGTTAGDFFFFGSRPEFLVLVALAVMLLGAVAAAAKDVTFSVVGLVWMVANAASTSAYVLYMRYATTKKDSAKLSKFGMVYVNNLLAIFFLLPAAWMSGEVDTFLSSGALHTWEYAGKNFFAGFVGFFLNFASLNCVQVTGATTYAIVGSLNKIPVALLGWAVFQDAITTQTWLFIAVGMSGGFLYSYAKLQSSRQNQKS